MAWLYFADTSRHTDYVLVLAITCIDAVLTLYVAIVAGLGLAAAGLTVFLAVLVAATWYARFLWRKDETRKQAPTPSAVKIRPAR